jgi:hypothetical protein
MPRPRQRVRLESGLSLDINRLARKRFIRFGALTLPVGIRWSNSYTGVASGVISADMSNPDLGWFRIRIKQLDQRITLVSRSRHFGGQQWFFICPRTARRAMVLWMPPGARSFASRQGWGGQVAYASQFSTPFDRADQGTARIKSRLCSIGGFDPDEWDIPPKPKWMRWRTYDRAVEKFDRYEEMLNQEVYRTMGRLMERF